MSLLNKVVVFGDAAGGADYGIQVVWDARANVDAAGEPISKYYPGDSRFFLVIVPAGIELVEVMATDANATVTEVGPVTRPQVDRLLFDEAGKLLNLSRLPAGAVTPTWYGRTATETVEGQRIKASVAPVLADIAYSYAAIQFRMTAPPELAIGPDEDDDWPIGVVVYAEVVS